jgi:hypothetical protein
MLGALPPTPPGSRTKKKSLTGSVTIGGASNAAGGPAGRSLKGRGAGLHFIGSCILIRLFSSQLRWCPASRRQRQNVKLFLREP